MIGAYCVSCSVFLFRTDDGSGTLSSVQSSLSSDDGLTLGGASAHFASNLGDGVPIV